MLLCWNILLPGCVFPGPLPHLSGSTCRQVFVSGFPGNVIKTLFIGVCILDLKWSLLSLDGIPQDDEFFHRMYVTTDRFYNIGVLWVSHWNNNNNNNNVSYIKHWLTARAARLHWSLCDWRPLELCGSQSTWLYLAALRWAKDSMCIISFNSPNNPEKHRIQVSDDK